MAAEDEGRLGCWIDDFHFISGCYWRAPPISGARRFCLGVTLIYVLALFSIYAALHFDAINCRCYITSALTTFHLRPLEAPTIATYERRWRLSSARRAARCMNDDAGLAGEKYRNDADYIRH